jgi:hypothetical protein
MSRNALLAFVILALLGISLVSWSAAAPPPKAKEAPRAEVLSDKTMLILTSDQSGHVLEKPCIHSIGGRVFVVGRAMKENHYVKEPAPDKVIWVPFEKVKEMIELD